MLIREIRESDAASFLQLCKHIEETSPFMLFEPQERNITVDRQRNIIKDIIATENQTILVADQNNDLIGYVMAIGGNCKRNRHSVHIAIGVSFGYRGKGIGRKLLEALENWAISKGIHRLGLTVINTNENAISLYQKVGFEVEGIKKHSLYINDEFVDELYMSKILN